MSADQPRIDPSAHMGPVRLRVADLDGARSFYERAIGLETIENGGSLLARLGAGGQVLVELESDPDAPQRPNRTTGLFHLALLVPDRARLGEALRRVSDAEWGLTGASDHLVSEALYTRDPEGNGIEIYRDRPREEWVINGGEIEMDSIPLDLQPILAEAGPESGPMAPGTRMGHVHLNVADIADTEAFYSGLLGFDVTVRSFPGALFVSAGGYHHHLGHNTWSGEGAPPPPEGSRGLKHFEIVVPRAEIDAIAGRMEAAGVAAEPVDGGIEARDPSANLVLVRAA